MNCFSRKYISDKKFENILENILDEFNFNEAARSPELKKYSQRISDAL